MRRWFTGILLMVLCGCSGSVGAQRTLQDADSLGNLWVVTVDLSGSMIDGGHFPGNSVRAKAQYLARQLKPRLLHGQTFDSVNYSRDEFLFFISGYLYGKLKKNEPSLDSCFIHHTDGKVHRFKSRDELVNHLCGLLDYSHFQYKYKQSFVSQIAPFSAVKASQYISKNHMGTRFRSMYVVTLTDDAEGTLQWMNDFNNIRKWDAAKAAEISDTTSLYLFNSLTGKGKGRMTELSADENGHVHVRSYRYELLDGAPKMLLENDMVDAKARNGHELRIAVPATYRDDSVRFVQIDSVRVNGKMYRVGKRFVPDEDGVVAVEYDVKRFRNDFTLYGSVQVAYRDTLWGMHLRKTYFEQQAHLMPARTISHLVIGAGGGALLLFILLMVWRVWLPRTQLMTIVMGGKEYIVLHSHRRNWKREGTQLLSCVKQSDGSYTAQLSSRRPMLKVVAKTGKKNDAIVIRSRFTLHFLKDETLRDGSLSFAAFEMEQAREKSQNFYTLKDVGTGVIAIVLPMVGRSLLISVEEEKERPNDSFFSALEQMVLQEYLLKRNGTCCDVIVAQGTHDGFIYWSVLVPEYDNGTGLPLSQARCLFFFRHPAQGMGTELLLELRSLLVHQIAKEHPEYKTIVTARVNKKELPMPDKCHFRVFYPVCGSYLCACENVQEKPSLQTLYSPMGSEWDLSCVAVAVRRMRSGKGTLLGTLLPYSVLYKAFPQGVPSCLWYGVGSQPKNPHTPQLLTFTEDSDCQHIVFHGQEYDGGRVAVSAQTLSFDIIVKQTFSF